MPEGVGKTPSANGAKRRGDVQPDRALRLQAIEGDPREGRAAVEDLADQGLVVGEELGLEAEAIGQGAEDVVVRAALAPRSDRRRVVHHVEMAVGAVDVHVLELRRGRQDDVGVVDRVGREQLVDDDEEVVAPQALEHAGLVGRDGRRVAL